MRLLRANATHSVLKLHMSFNDLLDKAADWVNACFMLYIYSYSSENVSEM